jgi:hypothetical protein
MSSSTRTSATERRRPTGPCWSSWTWTRISVRNPNKRVRFAGLQRLIYQPPGPLIHVVPWLRRFPIVHRLRGAALRLNSSTTRRPPMDPGLRQRLLEEMAPEVRELGTLIGRDLSPWLEAPVPRAA